jgi:REP-associated tyrosine transposase
MFMETFGEACEKTGWLVDAWVLMSNHYHLVLRTPQANLVAGMRWLQNTYTRRFNVRNQLGGHVFGGRYKAVLVESREFGSGDYLSNRFRPDGTFNEKLSIIVEGNLVNTHLDSLLP